jgi:hypothetical protein
MRSKFCWTKRGESPIDGSSNEEEPGPRHECTGHREHLLLAARQGASALRQAFAEAREEVEDPLEVGLHAEPVSPEEGAHLEVLAHRHAREDAPALRDDGQPPLDRLSGSHIVDELPVELDRPGGGAHDAEDGLHGRFARRVAAEEAHDLPLRDLRRSSPWSPDKDR